MSNRNNHHFHPRYGILLLIVIRLRFRHTVNDATSQPRTLPDRNASRTNGGDLVALPEVQLQHDGVSWTLARNDKSLVETRVGAPLHDLSLHRSNVGFVKKKKKRGRKEMFVSVKNKKSQGKCCCPFRSKKGKRNIYPVS